MDSIQVIHCDFSNVIHKKSFIELMNLYIQDNMGGGELIHGKKAKDLIEGMTNTPNAIVLFAEYKNKMVGLLNAFTSFATFSVGKRINIHDIIVLNEYRSKGIGTKLMKHIEAIATEQNCTKLTLEVRTDNKSAQKLYKKLGYGETKPKMLFWVKCL